MTGNDKYLVVGDSNSGDFLFYRTEDGQSNVKVIISDDTVWLSQRALAELYETSVPNVKIHIKGIYEDRELTSQATIKKYLIVQTEGVRQVERAI